MDYDLLRLLLASIGLLIRVIVEQSTSSKAFETFMNNATGKDYSLYKRVSMGYWLFYLGSWVLWEASVMLSTWPDRAEIGNTFLWILVVTSGVMIVGNSTILVANAQLGLAVSSMFMVIFQYIMGYVIMAFLLAMNAQHDFEILSYVMPPVAAIAGLWQAWSYASNAVYGSQLVAMIFRVGAEAALVLVIAHDKK